MLFLVRIFAIVTFSLLLGQFTQKIIYHLNCFCRHSGVQRFAAAAILISLATSLPELTIAVSSSLRGLSSLAFGNALGANMINLSVVTGITAFLAHRLFFNHSTHPQKLIPPLFCAFLPFVFAFNGVISRIEGIILILLYLVYIRSLILKTSPSTPLQSVRFFTPKTIRHLLAIFLWISLLLLTSQFIIHFAKTLSSELGLSLTFIGIFIISFGTTLPELFFNLKAVKSGSPSLATANIVGSCITNAAFIVGLSALIHPITFTDLHQLFLLASEYFFILVLFTFFAITQKYLEIWEAIILVVVFFFYSFLESI